MTKAIGAKPERLFVSEQGDLDHFTKKFLFEVEMLQVKLFAQARQLVGDPHVEIPWSDGQTVAVLKQTLQQRHPQLAPLIPRLLVAVNNDYAADDAVIQASDEVACFPPVSGG